MNSTILAGKHAEHYATRFLIDQGLKLVERNWRCRYGEIDLIMLDRATLVFVEVRYRKSTTFAEPLESVNRAKQQRIIATAHAFLQKNSSWQEHDCRFDVVAAKSSNQTYSFDWVQHAFEAL